ncbi:MAG: hypothetical protein GVY12_05180 [Bacteroidetes bacterium]|nr:hypothetical protein [Bacteroidota bacterium]
MTDQPTDGVGFHITSDPDRTEITQPGRDAVERPDVLPLRMLFASNLAPEGAAPDWSEGVHVVSLEAADFSPYLERVAPTLEVSLPNHVSGAPARISSTLQFTSLNDFRPERVAERLPLTAPLVGLRAGLRSVAAGDQTLEDVRASLTDGALSGSVEALLDALDEKTGTRGADANGRSAGSSGDALDRLLAMVDDAPADEDPADAPDALADALTEAVVGPSDTPARPPSDALAQVVTRLEGLIRAQLQPLFSDPDFRALEAAWRTLRLLTKRLPFRKGVQLDVLAAAPDQLNEAIHHRRCWWIQPSAARSRRSISCRTSPPPAPACRAPSLRPRHLRSSRSTTRRRCMTSRRSGRCWTTPPSCPTKNSAPTTLLHPLYWRSRPLCCGRRIPPPMAHWSRTNRFGGRRPRLWAWQWPTAL